jgi:alginate O-acetyltransferase complex protein AlgI
MVFNSFSFLVFFPVVTILYFLLPHKFRWLYLLTASCIFYMFFIPVYIFILAFTIIIDYFAGILIENAQGKRRKLFLLMSIIANIGVLAFFKYYNFLNQNLTHFLNITHFNNPIPFLDIILPIGLSFHTFQAMSYTIEVYRGNQKSERHFGIYALYVMFYPQLVAGPIERPQNLIWQFREKHKFDSDRVIAGLKLMLWGLFKKVVIADRLSAYVADVFNYPHLHRGQTLNFWIAAIFFTWQLYCDFSGYSDIAIGAAQVMGFKLMTNFRRPFLSHSFAELWQRWHISLTSWFMDYVFKPLGGYRKGIAIGIFNLFIVMFLSGLWHGANWTYVVCFLSFAFFLILRIIFKKQVKAFDKAVYSIGPPFFGNVVCTLIQFFQAVIPLVFFRAKTLHDGAFILKSMFTPGNCTLVRGSGETLFYSIIGIIILYTVEIYQEYFNNKAILPEPRSTTAKYVFYATVVVLILMLGVFDGSQFIYFQF